MARMGNGIRNSKTAAATPAIIVLAALVSHAAAAEAAQLLSEKPPRSAATNEFQARTSTIEPSLTIAYDVLAGAANAAARGGPPSPENPRSPDPATVEIIPPESTTRTRAVK